ncbi:hypothetical protein MPER_05604 [Moniliophthora perniciosa FA553]|nr:hypothetical protein MPER_05604 [Moniliophthora perniciosa FA553]
MTQLIVFRALQGIGGSAIYSGVVVTISTIVPREKIGGYTSIIGTVFAASSVSGPLIGGAIVQRIHLGMDFLRQFTYRNRWVSFIALRSE